MGYRGDSIIWVKVVPTLKVSCETFRAVYINDTLMKKEKGKKKVHIIPIDLYERLQRFSFPFPFSFSLLANGCPAEYLVPGASALAKLAEARGGGRPGGA